jgi:betaine-aldehyde dehydrogenase
MNSSKTAQKVEPARHWIAGQWISSSNVAESVNPSTGEVLGQYSAGGRVEAAAAITAARKAFNAGVWSHDPQLRSRALLELADRLDERADAIALTISREEGKTLGQATLEATWSPSTLRTTQELHYRKQARQLRSRQAYSQPRCASRSE